MYLNELKEQDKAIIIGFDCDDPLKFRMFSFGLSKGVEFLVLKITLARKTYEIKTKNGNFALRREEAEKVKVEYAE